MKSVHDKRLERSKLLHGGSGRLRAGYTLINTDDDDDDDVVVITLILIKNFYK